MINYSEKGIGLHDAINKAGYLLVERDGVWTSTDDSAVQAIIDNYSLADAKAYAMAQVMKKAKGLRDKVVSAVSPGEMSSWAIKVAEASKYRTTGNASSCPMLGIEATARQVPLETLVSKVEANSDRLSTIEAMIGGVDGRHRDAIAALNSFEAISQYNYHVGWPEV